MTEQKPKIDFAVGGQAIIEGVMMRSPNHYTVTVRDPHGNLRVQQVKHQSIFKRKKWLNIPFLRGFIQLIESMSIAFKALDFSSKISLGESTEEGDLSWWQKVLGIVSMIFSLGITLSIMKVGPLWVAERAADIWPAVEANYLLFNAVDGLAKIVIFFGYILFISLMKDIRRTFGYHGAEHKSVWTYEKGLPLTLKNARKQTRFHPRCGTSFMFLVLIISVFVYTVFPPVDGFLAKLAIRIAVIPLVAGIGYEILKLDSKYNGAWWLKPFTLPGVFFQTLTTREPDDNQLKVALHSLKLSLEAENASS